MSRPMRSLGLSISVTAALFASALPALAAQSLKIAYTAPRLGWGPLYVASEKGFFADEGLEVEIRQSDRAAPQAGFDLLATRQIDGRLTSIDEAALHWRAQAPFAVMLATDVSSGGDGLLVRNDRSIGSIEQLRGKRIGLWLTTASDFFLNDLLQQNGMSERDVTLVDLPAEAAAGAVVAGLVDAAVTWSPWLAEAAADANVSILATSKDRPGLIVDVLIMREETLIADPQACRRLVRGWNRAIAWQRSNPDEAAAIIAKGLDQGSAAAVEAGLAGITLQGQADNARLFAGSGPGTARAAASLASRLWTRLGRLTSAPTPEDLIDARCLES